MSFLVNSKQIQSYTNEQFQIHVRYPCSLCDFKAAKKYSLKRHKMSVNESVKYPCNQCDYKAGLKTNLKRHVRSIHKSVMYPCN